MSCNQSGFCAFGNSWWWIIILLLIFGTGNNGCGNGFGDSSCMWILILLLCCGGCGNGTNFLNGCGNNGYGC